MDQIESKTKLLDVMPLAKHYMDQLNLYQLFDRYFPKSNMMDLAPAQVLSVMVMNIINAARPLYKVSDWVAVYLDGMGEEPSDALKYNDDRLARTLDRLFDGDRQSLMVDLAANAIQAHQLQTDTIHNDSTTITFKGQYDHQIAEAVKLQHGHNKDFRPDCLQIVYGLNITADGNIPLSFQLFDGNQTDDNTHIPNWEQLRQMLGKTDFVYVADCKLCNENNLDYISQNGGYFITVVPKNRSILNPFYHQLKNGQVQWQLAYSTQDNRKPSRKTDYSTFETPPTEKGYRLIWVLSSAKAEMDRKTRQRRIAKAEANLKDLTTRLNRYRLKTRKNIEAAVAKICRGVDPYLDVQVLEQKTVFRKKVSPGRPGPNSVYKNCTKTTYQIQWQLNQSAIEQAALADGTFPLITNTDKSCADVLRTYKQQPCLEKRFSTTKSVLEIAPVFLEKSSRIEAMTFLYFVALMVISLMERAIRKQMAEEGIEKLPILPEKMKTSRPTWNNLRYLFRGVHQSQIFLDGQLVKQTLKGLLDIHVETLRLLGVSPSAYSDLGPDWLTFSTT
jgi:transposase